MSFSHNEINIITNYINMYRIKHKSQLINHNLEISKFSQNYANNLALTQQFKHSQNRKYGENLYMSMSSRGINKNDLVSYIKKAIDSWYNEIKDYNFENGEFNSKTGHFTQLIWNNSTEYGIGIGINNNSVYVCMNYNPPGNILRQFKQNVFKN